MDPRITTPEFRGRKRISSRRSSLDDTEEDITSSTPSKISGTAARYRWVVLQHVRIIVESRPLPAEIQTRVNAIIRQKVSDKRRRELSRVAEKLRVEFIVVLSGASREDDCVEPIHRALSSMDSGGKFTFPRKTGMADLIIEVHGPLTHFA